jgi:uncharacterized protein YndB with AHSA1/START domain
MTTAWTYEHAFPIPAAPGRIFAALTGQEELEGWFAEGVRIDPREGGTLHFWGRHTLGTPEEGEAGGAITSFEAPRRLAFEWELFGAPSTVTIELTPEDGEAGPSTRVTIRHAFEHRFEGVRSEEMVDDWWRYNLGNLMAWTTGRADVLRVDFADPSPEIRIAIEVQAPPEKIFRALTEPEALNQWMAKDARVELREGGAWDLGWPTPEGYTGPAMEILELVPNRRLTVRWPDWRGDATVPPQTVTWELVPAGAGTRVTLIHAGFVRAVDVSDYPFGWRHFLDQMKAVAEAL